MEKIAFISGGTFIYWSSIILTLAVVAAMAVYAGLYIYKSGNVAGGGAFNRALIEAYQPRIKHL